MSQLSNYLENALFNAVLRNTAYTSPVTVYLALYTSDPTDADAGAEVSGGSYARVSAAFTAPSNGAGDNSAQLNFATPSADWGTVTHWGIRDASTSGNLLLYGAMAASRTIKTNDTVKVNVGDLDVSFA